jgi:hypothetical protein
MHVTAIARIAAFATLASAVAQVPGPGTAATNTPPAWQGPPPVPTRGKPVLKIDAPAWAAVTAENRRLLALPPDRCEAAAAAGEFPGAVPGDAPRVTASLVLDTALMPLDGTGLAHGKGSRTAYERRATDWFGTGLYAAPGESVAVVLPAQAASLGVTARIGCHSDRLWHLTRWQRFPDITRTFPLKPGTNLIANAFGGLIYLEVPRATSGPRCDIRISGAVRAPRFVLGRTSAAEWRTLRHAPAPWAELESDKLILCVPSSHVRTLDDPAALMRGWDRVMDANADLLGIPRRRMRPERIVCDVQISAGYLHAGYPIMAPLNFPALLVDTNTLAKGDWGLFHELGHQHQDTDWTFSGTGEVTVNLFTLYVLQTVCTQRDGPGHEAISPQRRERAIREHLAAGAPFDRWRESPFLALTMYCELIEAFGWDTFRKVFAEYRALPPGQRPASDDAKRDLWLVRMSQATGRNLGPFFETWGVPVSPAARASVKHLPPWMPEELLRIRTPATPDRPS